MIECLKIEKPSYVPLDIQALWAFGFRYCFVLRILDLIGRESDPGFV